MYIFIFSSSFTFLTKFFLFSDSISWVYSTGITPYRCSRCLKYFKSSKSRTNHRGICGKDKKFGCALCAYRAHQRGNVIRHLTSKHPEVNEIDHHSLIFNSNL